LLTNCQQKPSVSDPGGVTTADRDEGINKCPADDRSHLNTDVTEPADIQTTEGLRVGILVGSEFDLDAQTWLALAHECDQSGFDALMRSDHFLPRGCEQEYGSLEAWTSCAAAAVGTRRIKLGTLMSPVTFRHPSLLAKAVLTVDQFSSGRAELGLGIGWNETEHRAYGLSFPDTRVRYKQLEEQLELLSMLWGPAPKVSFTGLHYALSDCVALPKPLQRPRMIVGKRGKHRSVEIATRLLGSEVLPACHQIGAVQ
jgi:alkanesulfonate monooxygenase SsuD/methylene tetrahydromethanopterin reductase-like flavin-dependent oxidoreductase (luciferase family)